MIDTSPQKPKAILVDLIEPSIPKEEGMKRLEELENLVRTFGGIAVVKIIQKRGLPDYRTFIGSGKVEEIRGIAKELLAGLVIINNQVKPMQMFNLSETLRKDHIKVWDRIDLILKIFEKHAKSTEAKLQIELAEIRHMGPRITGMGAELMQQRGGTAMRSGQGETNTELMKRHFQKQELKIVEKLKHYDLIREGQRRQRTRRNLKTAALVGYTNAGKSSLLNALTGKDVYIADELFATLDTRVAQLYLPEKQSQILLSDTIGFIQNLPPSLIQAFKSTLAETIEADLLLHVIDVGDPEMNKKITVVEEILTQLDLADRPKVYIFNKIDNVKERLRHNDRREDYPGLLTAEKGLSEKLGWTSGDKKRLLAPAVSFPALKKKFAKFSPVFVSAVSKKNLDELIQVIQGKLF